MKTYGELVAYHRELLGRVVELEKVIRQSNHPDNLPDIESGKTTLADLAMEKTYRIGINRNLKYEIDLFQVIA